MKKATPPDWGVIDELILAGDLSVRAIASDHGISETAIRKRIKARGLVRNLKKRIADRAEQKLVAATAKGMQRAALVKEVREITADLSDEAEEAAIEATAEALAVIIGRQRHESHRAKTLVDQLIGDLTAAAAHRQTLEQMIEEDARAPAGDDGKPGQMNHRLRASLERAVSLPTQAKAAQQLVQALKSVQELERRAWGITDDGPPPSPPGESSELLQGVRALALAWKDRHNEKPAA